MSAVMDTVCYNDNITNCYRSFMASAAKKQRRSALDRKIHKLKKMLKPVMALVTGRKSEKTYYHKEAQPAPAPACCWADSCEADDNAANEALEARLQDELVHGAGVKGAAIQVWVGGQVVEIPITPGQPQVIPVHFVIDQDAADGFCWTPLCADGDLCCHDDLPYLTEHQVPEMQVPCGPCAPCAC